MNRNRSGIARGRRWLCLMAMMISCTVLLVIGTNGAATAGPAQEKGQEEPKETKDKPKKYTNDDLKQFPESSGGGGESGESIEDGRPPETGETAESGDQPAEQTDPWDSVGVAADSQGRGEAYWRQAMTEARAAVANAKAQRAVLQSEMNRRQADFTAMDDPSARELVNSRIEELFDLIAEADKAIADAEQGLQDLEEDARRSGALPGWLR